MRFLTERLQGLHSLPDLRDLPSPVDTFNSRAQTERLGTNLQRGTATPKQMLQKRFETASAPYSFIHFHDLAQSELPPTRPNGHIIPQAPKKDSNLGKSEAPFRSRNEREGRGPARHRGSGAGRSRGVETRGRPFFAEANGRRVQARPSGEFANLHTHLRFSCENRLT